MNDDKIHQQVRSIRSVISMAMSQLNALELQLGVEPVKAKRKSSWMQHLEDVKASGKKWAKPAELKKKKTA